MKREKKKKMKFCLIAGRRLTVLRRTTYARFTRPAQLKQFNPEISGTMGNEVALNGFYWIPLIRRRKRRECSFSSWWRRRIGAQFDFSSDNKSWFTGARWFLKIIRFPFTFHENRFAIFSVLVFFFFWIFPYSLRRRRDFRCCREKNTSEWNYFETKQPYDFLANDWLNGKMNSVVPLRRVLLLLRRRKQCRTSPRPTKCTAGLGCARPATESTCKQRYAAISFALAGDGSRAGWVCVSACA